MRIKHNNFFFEEDAGGGGGASEFFEPLETPTEETTSQVQTETKPVEVKQAPTVDAKALAAEFGSVLAERDKSQQAAKAPPMSEADIKKALKVWEPDDQFVTEFGNLETQKAAFSKLRDGLIQQADTIMQARLYEMQQNFNKQFQPMQQYLSQQETKAREEQFYTQYKALDKPSVRQNLPAIAQRLASEGAFQGKSVPESFAVLAKGVEAVIKEFNPEFTIDSSANQTTVRTSNAIRPTSSGSGGGGASNGQKANLPVAARILGELKMK